MATFPRPNLNNPNVTAEQLRRIEELYAWGYIAWDDRAGCARMTAKGWAALSMVAEPPIEPKKEPECRR